MGRLILFLLATWLISGCTTQRNASQAPSQVPEQAPFPAVSVFSSWLDNQAQQQCDNFAASSRYHQCVEEPIDSSLYYQALAASGQFEQTAMSAANFDYEILIASAAMQSASPWQKISHFLGLTAGNNNDKLRVQIEVQWRGQSLASFDYQLPLDDTGGQATKDLSQQVMDGFLADAANQGIFSAEYLFSALGASDYQRQLTIPDGVQGFELSHQHLFHNPLQGIMFRYEHPLYSDDLFDVFIYPVARASWQDASEVLLAELESEKQDISLIADARGWQLSQQQDMTSLHWHSEQGFHQGYVLAVNTEKAGHSPLFATTYVFLLEDKVVKFSANFPAEIATDLVKEALPQLQVPCESTLMSQLRAQG